MSELTVEQVSELNFGIKGYPDGDWMSDSFGDNFCRVSYVRCLIADWHLKREALLIISGRRGYCTSGCDAVADDALAIEKGPQP